MTSPTLSEKVKDILDKVRRYYLCQGSSEAIKMSGVEAHQAIMEEIIDSVPVTLNGFKNPREEMLRRLQ